MTPNSRARRATYATRALATNVLVGVQPTLTQVPPTSLRSITPVFHPASAIALASGFPALPRPNHDRIENFVRHAVLLNYSDAAKAFVNIIFPESSYSEFDLAAYPYWSTGHAGTFRRRIYSAAAFETFKYYNGGIYSTYLDNKNGLVPYMHSSVRNVNSAS